MGRVLMALSAPLAWSWASSVRYMVPGAHLELGDHE